MPRENVADKARRMLGHGNVVIVETHGRYVRAEVRGDTGIYEVVHDHGAWSCPCDARTACSHVRAVQLVTAPVRLRAIA